MTYTHLHALHYFQTNTGFRRQICTQSHAAPAPSTESLIGAFSNTKVTKKVEKLKAVLNRRACKERGWMLRTLRGWAEARACAPTMQPERPSNMQTWCCCLTALCFLRCVLLVTLSALFLASLLLVGVFHTFCGCEPRWAACQSAVFLQRPAFSGVSIVPAVPFWFDMCDGGDSCSALLRAVNLTEPCFLNRASCDLLQPSRSWMSSDNMAAVMFAVLSVELCPAK